MLFAGRKTKNNKQKSLTFIILTFYNKYKMFFGKLLPELHLLELKKQVLYHFQFK